MAKPRPYAEAHARRILSEIDPVQWSGLPRWKLREAFGIADHPARALWRLLNRETPTPAAPVVTGGMKSPQVSDEELSIEDLIERRAGDARRTIARARRMSAPVTVNVPAGPLAIVHFGDPHLDDDGCDWDQLRADIAVVQSHPSVYAGNVGDTVNNWVGRLVKLWAHQGTTDTDAWRLAEWFMQEMPWAYWVHGNHDEWNDGRRILELLLRGSTVMHSGPSDVKIALTWPDGTEHRMHVRHDFKGHSQYNANHGLKKAALWGGWADVYIAGHRHTWAISQDEYDDGRVRWLVRARGYKRADSYARDRGFHEQRHGAAVMTVHDPGAAHDAAKVRTFLDLEQGRDYLAWLRRSRGLD